VIFSSLSHTLSRSLSCSLARSLYLLPSPSVSLSLLLTNGRAVCCASLMLCNHTPTHNHTYAHARTRTHTYILTHAHAHTHVRTHACAHARTHTQTHMIFCKRSIYSTCSMQCVLPKWQCVAVGSNVLQCVAECCSVLQCVPIFSIFSCNRWLTRSIFQEFESETRMASRTIKMRTVCCIMLQCVAVC